MVYRKLAIPMTKHGNKKIKKLKWKIKIKKFLILIVPTPQNGQTHSNNSLAFANELFECVWPFCGVGA